MTFRFFRHDNGDFLSEKEFSSWKEAKDFALNHWLFVVDVADVSTPIANLLSKYAKNEDLAS